MDKNIYDEKSEVRSPPQERRRRIRVRPPQQPSIPQDGPPPQPAVSNQPSGADPEVEPPSGRPRQDAGQSHKQLVANARQEVGRQRRAGKARVKSARLLSRSPTYLSAKIPPGDWTRRARRRHLKDARRQAAAEWAAIKAEETAKLEAARAGLSAATANSRLSRTG